MRARQQRRRVQIRILPELHDALGDLVGMRLFLVRVLEELRGDEFRADAVGGVVVPLVTQHADDFRGERRVQQLDDRLAILLGETRRHRAFHHLLARARAQRGQVGDEGLVARRWRRLLL